MRTLLLALLLLASSPVGAATLVHGRMIQDGSVGTADLADDAVTADKISFSVPNVDVTNTFNADQTIRSQDAGATEGPLLDLWRTSATPAANDELGALRFRATDDAAAVWTAGVIGARIVDPGAASNDGVITFATMIADSLASRFHLGAGFFYQGGADPGAGAINATGLQINGAALPLVREYTSANQTITAAGTLTLAHGLGAMPELIQLRLKCLTAELGYSIGDETIATTGIEGGNRGVSVVPDATNVVIRFGSDATSMTVVRKDTGATAAITNANWALIVKAWN